MGKQKNEAQVPVPAPVAYADAMRRLQEIVAGIEEGEVDIDRLADSVKEAATLVATCRARLRGAQAEVERAIKEMEDSDPADLWEPPARQAVVPPRPAPGAVAPLDPELLDPFAEE